MGSSRAAVHAHGSTTSPPAPHHLVCRCALKGARTVPGRLETSNRLWLLCQISPHDIPLYAVSLKGNTGGVDAPVRAFHRNRARQSDTEPGGLLHIQHIIPLPHRLTADKSAVVHRIALKSLTRIYLELHDEIADLEVMIMSTVDELAPELIKRKSVGYECASQLLITAGDNPQRPNSESGSAALCGVSPVLVSSGKTNRHRLNRGGDRAANSALHIITIGRLRTDTRTQEYVAKRVAEGHSKMEAPRCLKRYISREVYTLLRNQNRLINSTQITT